MIEKMLSVYKKVYSEQFNGKELESRKQMQMGIFILSLSGMSFHNYYGFVWGEFGPYSSELADDLKIYADIDNSENYEFCEKENKLIDRFKKMIEKYKENYSVVEIVEAKASMMFFQEINHNFSEDKILNELLKRKPYLNDIKANREILRWVLN